MNHFFSKLKSDLVIWLVQRGPPWEIWNGQVLSETDFQIRSLEHSPLVANLGSHYEW